MQGGKWYDNNGSRVKSLGVALNWAKWSQGGLPIEFDVWAAS